MNFATLKGLTIPEGVVTQIADASGRVLWKLETSKPVVLEVEKITSGTYAGEAAYTGEQFILLDIYPKTNGTVKVTYGGLTKTITDTSGAEEPNAQQVFFGTFNGVSDSVATPASGELTIKGDCAAFGCGWYTSLNGKSNNAVFTGVTAIESFGNCETIPSKAFKKSTLLKNVGALDNITSIGDEAFAGCTNLENMVIPATVNFTPAIFRPVGDSTSFTMRGSFLTVDENHPTYSCKGSCLITKANNEVVLGFSDAVIPSGVTSIGARAFYNCLEMSAIFTIPEGVKTIGDKAFYSAEGITDFIIPASLTNIGLNGCFCSAVRIVSHATTPPTVDVGSSGAYPFMKQRVESVTVPKGCGDAYKAAKGWLYFKDLIVEAS